MQSTEPNSMQMCLDYLQISGHPRGVKPIPQGTDGHIHPSVAGYYSISKPLLSQTTDSWQQVVHVWRVGLQHKSRSFFMVIIISWWGSCSMLPSNSPYCLGTHSPNLANTLDRAHSHGQHSMLSKEATSHTGLLSRVVDCRSSWSV